MSARKPHPELRRRDTPTRGSPTSNEDLLFIFSVVKCICRHLLWQMFRGWLVNSLNLASLGRRVQARRSWDRRRCRAASNFELSTSDRDSSLTRWQQLLGLHVCRQALVRVKVYLSDLLSVSSTGKPTTSCTRNPQQMYSKTSKWSLTFDLKSDRSRWQTRPNSHRRRNWRTTDVAVSSM